MIHDAKKTKIIFVFPQNLTYDCKYNSYQLKNVLDDFSYLIYNYLDIPHGFRESLSLGFENNKTIINESVITSSFYFRDEFYEILTRTVDSDKITTIKNGNMVYTTLNLSSYEEMQAFIDSIKLVKVQEEIPQWLEEYSFYDDEDQKANLIAFEKQIEEIKKSIKNTESVLKRNERIKSILISTGDELVEQIFYIFKDIFKVDLSHFKDEKKEDFLFEYENTTFIGEIKGVNSGVLKKHISQLDDHFTNYIDDLEEQGISKKVIPLLIINHQRKTELKDRQPIMKDVKEKAEKNAALIIETSVLLKIYEKFLKNEIDEKYIFNIITNSIGVLAM